MAEAGKETIRRQARSREMVLLLGESDNDPNHRWLPNDCRDSLQGRHRLERGLMFKAHLDRFFRPHNTRVVRVRSVGHSSSGMYQSAKGLEAIFY